MNDDVILRSRILIVDDEPLNVELLERMLGNEGFQNIVSTTDSSRVHELCQAFRPDIVLLDLRMPGLSGYDILSRISAQRSEDWVPVIVLTADVTREARHRALSLGAHDFLTKPFDAIECVLRVWNLLETRHLYLQLLSLAPHTPAPRRRSLSDRAGS